MDADPLGLHNDELLDATEAEGLEPKEPKTKKAKVVKAARKIDKDGAPVFVIDDDLDKKGIDAWMKKCANDKVTGDLWKFKAKSIVPANVGKEMVPDGTMHGRSEIDTTDTCFHICEEHSCMFQVTQLSCATWNVRCAPQMES